MSTEVQNTNQELSPRGNAVLRKIENAYTSDYPGRPAPQSIEQLADHRDAIPMLYEIIQLKDQTFANTLITTCITAIVSKHVHVIRGMDGAMAASTAELITQRYPMMNPADVKFFVTKGVMGEYGKILDRVDGALVLQWAHDYWDQMKHLIKMRQRNEEAYDPKVPVPPEIEKLSEKLRVGVTQKNAKAVIPENKKTLAEEYAARGLKWEEE